MADGPVAVTAEGDAVLHLLAVVVEAVPATRRPPVQAEVKPDLNNRDVWTLNAQSTVNITSYSIHTKLSGIAGITHLLRSTSGCQTSPAERWLGAMINAGKNRSHCR